MARAELYKHDADFRHWTFVFQFGRLVEWGRNTKTITALSHLGYDPEYQFAHAEPIALRRAWGLLDKSKGFTIVNVRLLANGKLAISKPCQVCFPLIVASGCTECFWTTSDGTFERWNLNHDSSYSVGRFV